MGEPKITLVGAGGMSFGPTMVNDVVHTPRLAREPPGAPRRRRRAAAARLPVRGASSTPSAGAPVGPRLLDRSGRGARRRGLRASAAPSSVASATGARTTRSPTATAPARSTARTAGPARCSTRCAASRTRSSICANIEKYCPDAFLINLTNPMSRVTLAINRATQVRNVGMCHEMPIGINRLARRLRVTAKRHRGEGVGHQPLHVLHRVPRPAHRRGPAASDPRVLRQAVLRLLAADAGGRRSGLDRGAARCAAARVQLPPARRAHGPRVRPRALLGRQPHRRVPAVRARRRRVDAHAARLPRADHARRRASLAAWAATTKVPFPLQALGHSHEEVVPIIAAMWTDDADAGSWRSTCPTAATCPTSPTARSSRSAPRSTANGIHPDTMPPLGEPLAGWIATQVQPPGPRRRVGAHRRPRPGASQAVIEDPCSPPDEAACRAMFDELRALQADASAVLRHGESGDHHPEHGRRVPRSSRTADRGRTSTSCEVCRSQRRPTT